MDSYFASNTSVLPEIVSFSNERHRPSTQPTLQQPQQQQNNNNDYDDATEEDGSGGASSSFQHAASFSPASGPMSNANKFVIAKTEKNNKVATTLGSIACSIMRQHERDRRVADVNDLRGTIPVPVAKKQQQQVVSDPNHLRHFDRSVSLEVRRLLASKRRASPQRRGGSAGGGGGGSGSGASPPSRQAKRPLSQSEIEQQIGSPQQHQNARRLSSPSRQQQLELERQLDESTQEFLEALETKLDAAQQQQQQRQNQQTSTTQQQQQFVRQTSSAATSSAGSYDSSTVGETSSTNIQQSYQQPSQAQQRHHSAVSSSSSVIHQVGENDSSAGGGEYEYGFQQQQQRDDTTTGGSNDNPVDQQHNPDLQNSALITHDGAPYDAMVLVHSDLRNNRPSTGVLNSFGEPRRAKMALFDNPAFKQPYNDKMKPMSRKGARSPPSQQRDHSQQQQQQQQNDINNNSSGGNNNNSSSVVMMMQQQQQQQQHALIAEEESPVSRRRRRFEQLRAANVAEQAPVYKTPAAAQFTYIRTFHNQPAPPQADLPGAITKRTLLNANKRGGIGSRDGTYPCPQAGAAAEELFHPINRYRRSSGALLQTAQGKSLNDALADTCIVNQHLVDDEGNTITDWPSVTVAGTGFRSNGRRLEAALQRYRGQLLKASNGYWKSHPTPPRRASLIEKHVQKERRKRSGSPTCYVKDENQE